MSLGGGGGATRCIVHIQARVRAVTGLYRRIPGASMNRPRNKLQLFFYFFDPATLLSACISVVDGLFRQVIGPAGTIRWPYVDPMLVHRLRRWPNIGST